MTIDELNAALIIKGKLNRIKGRLADLRTTGGLAGMSSGEPVTGGIPNDVYIVLIRLADEEKELETAFHNEQIIIRRKLQGLELTDEQFRVLELRYVDCLLWGDISDLMGYSRRMVFNFNEEGKKIALHCT